MNSKEFQIDDLDYTLAELQKEKHSLANQLTECKNKRQGLEKTLEAVHKKHSQLSEVHRKLSETLQVGYHKVAQMQSQAESLENHIQKKRDEIKDITKKYEEQKNSQLNHVKYIEEQLSEITKKMKDAKSFYTKANILKEVEAVETKKIEMEKQILFIEADAETVRMQVKTLLQNLENFKSDAVDDFTESFKDEVLKIFQEESDEYDKHYSQLKKELGQLEMAGDGSAS